MKLSSTVLFIWLLKPLLATNYDLKKIFYPKLPNLSKAITEYSNTYNIVILQKKNCLGA